MTDFSGLPPEKPPRWPWWSQMAVGAWIAALIVVGFVFLVVIRFLYWLSQLGS